MYAETLSMWQSIKNQCADITLKEQKDKIFWRSTANGHFSMKSFYLLLKTQAIGFPHKFLWKTRLPLKIKVFIWLVVKRTILTKENLIKMGVERKYKLLILWYE